MDHLNLFNPFENHDVTHEDVLTRNFLILLKYIPLVQVAFFDLIEKGLESKGERIPSVARGELTVTDVKTQVDSGSSFFKSLSEVKVLSIIISDDAFSEEHKVENSERHARYDGVILADPSWLFLIENKPYAGNIWKGQLNPNLSGIDSPELVPCPCAISWRELLCVLNNLSASGNLNNIEKRMIEDFLVYVDSNYSWLNAFNRFLLCKDNLYLLQKKCNAVLLTYKPDQDIKYHKGWKYYIDSEKPCVKMIALDCQQMDNSWEIGLWMYAGDTMTVARDTYERIEVEKVNELLNSDHNFSVSCNFHYSFRSTGLMGFSSKIRALDYINYWKTHRAEQLSGKEAFKDHFVEMKKLGIITGEVDDEFQSLILDKGYPKLNVCPGLLFKYTWSKERAIELDSKDEFDEDVKRKISAVFGTMNLE